MHKKAVLAVLTAAIFRGSYPSFITLITGTGVLFFRQMLSGTEILGVALVAFSVIMMNASGKT